MGIEAVGIVEDAPGGEFKKSDVVATAMGGMGRVSLKSSKQDVTGVIYSQGMHVKSLKH